MTIEPDKIDRYRLPRGYVRTINDELGVFFNEVEYRELLRIDADLLASVEVNQRLSVENSGLRRHCEDLQRDLTNTKSDLEYFKSERAKLHTNLDISNKTIKSLEGATKSDDKELKMWLWIVSALGITFLVSTIVLAILLAL